MVGSVGGRGGWRGPGGSARAGCQAAPSLVRRRPPTPPPARSSSLRARLPPAGPTRCRDGARARQSW